MTSKIDGVDRNRVKNLKARIETMFNSIALCGPKTFKSPDSREKNMCELLYPYKHFLDTFYVAFEQLFSTDDFRAYLRSQNAATDHPEYEFIELMQKRQNVKLSKQLPLSTMLKAKQGTKKGGTCKKYTTSRTGKTLAQWKNEFCIGFQHLDLVEEADETIKNIAMVYVGDDIKLDDKYMKDLPNVLRYIVKDDCGSPMFLPESISLQKIQVLDKMEWVGLVTLDSTSEDGYLRREIPQCKTLPYLPKTTVETKVFVDMNNCCEGTRDVAKCKKMCLEPLRHYHTKQPLEYKVAVTGTTYELIEMHMNRRRRLLKYRRGGC
jgi:hypothetical protein